MENDNERKNLNFVQFDRRAMSSHRQLIRKSSLAAEILSFFTEKMNKQNALVCSYKALQELTGYSRATVARAIKVLKDDQWIQVIKIGNANAYVVNSAAFWTTAANGKKYSMFHATVIAAESEQEQLAIEMNNLKLKTIPVWDSENEIPTLGNEELPPPDQKDIDLS